MDYNRMTKKSFSIECLPIGKVIFTVAFLFCSLHLSILKNICGPAKKVLLVFSGEAHLFSVQFSVSGSQVAFLRLKPKQILLLRQRVSKRKKWLRYCCYCVSGLASIGWMANTTWWPRFPIHRYLWKAALFRLGAKRSLILWRPTWKRLEK